MNTLPNTQDVVVITKENVIHDLKRKIEDKDRMIDLLRASVNKHLERMCHYEKLLRKAQEELINYKALTTYEIFILRWKQRHK